MARTGDPARGRSGLRFDDASITRQRVAAGTVRRIIPYAFRYRRPMALLVLATVTTAVLTATSPLILRAVINDGILPKHRGTLMWLCLAVAGAAIVAAAAMYLEAWASGQVGEGVVCDLRNQVFTHVQRQPLAFFTRAQTGSLVSRLNSDIIGARDAMTGLLSQAVSTVLTLVLVLTVMFYLSWQITLIALLVVPLFLLPTRLIARRLQRLTRERMRLDAEMGSLMNERFNVAGATLAKLYGREEEESGLFARKAGRIRDVSILTAVYQQIPGVLGTLLAALTTAMVYGIGGRLTIDGTLKLGTLVAMVALLMRLYAPVNQLTMLQSTAMTALVSFDRIFELLNLEPSVTERPDALVLALDGNGKGSADGVTDEAGPGAEAAGAGSGAAGAGAEAGAGAGAEAGAGAGADTAAAGTGSRWTVSSVKAPDIVFKDVHFRYPDAAEVSLASLESIATRHTELPDHTPVLKGLTFHAPAGKLTALVGPSGAGKSTITHLLTRLYDPTNGTIHIAGHNIRDLTLQSLRDTIGVVSQDAHLFHDTLRANLQYARPHTTEDDLVQACRAAHIWDTVNTLPNGLDTMVGDRGYRLSGGEKQRIALARLLIKSPPVVILDEATAHLDSESEAAIQHALKTILRHRTSLVIAHRLSTVRDADQILVISNGHIHQQGTHEQLLTTDGRYADLYRTQFADQLTTDA